MHDINAKTIEKCMRVFVSKSLKKRSALFRREKILDFATVAFSFVCGKYCLIID